MTEEKLLSKNTLNAVPARRHSLHFLEGGFANTDLNIIDSSSHPQNFWFSFFLFPLKRRGSGVRIYQGLSLESVSLSYNTWDSFFKLSGPQLPHLEQGCKN